MRKIPVLAISIVALALPLAACNDPRDTATAEQSYGAAPTLPAPEKSWLPTVNIATATSWPAGAKPTAASGMTVNAFATGLDHPRTLHVLPNGDVLVAESNAPPKADGAGGGIKGFVFGQALKWAGASVPSANRITLLRDADGDGVAEFKSVFLEGLNSPFGMALVGEDFYVANADAIVKFPYRAGDTKITTPGVKLADLPGGPINHHWTKDLIASPDGTKLYATVGSNSNVGENGMEAEANRAAVLEVDRASGATRLFASGLRNPNGPAWEPQDRRAVGGRQRARRTRQRSGAGLHDLGEGRRASMAGPTAISASMSMPASSRSGPIWWRKPLRPTTRWARTPPRSGSPSTPAICFRKRWPAAPSSASTARGTGNRAPATR